MFLAFSTNWAEKRINVSFGYVEGRRLGTSGTGGGKKGEIVLTVSACSSDSALEPVVIPPVVPLALWRAVCHPVTMAAGLQLEVIRDMRVAFEMLLIARVSLSPTARKIQDRTHPGTVTQAQQRYFAIPPEMRVVRPPHFEAHELPHFHRLRAPEVLWR